MANTDARMELVARMDQAGLAMDVARMRALGRLNWRLVDPEVLQFSAHRLQLVQAQQQQAQQMDLQYRQQQQLSAQRQALEQSRSDWALGNAAIAIGASPSEFMSGRVTSYGGNSGSSTPTDPRVHLYQGVHEVLVSVASQRGGPDPQVAPAFAARALDVLENRMSTADAVKLLVDSAPTAPGAQAVMLKLASKIPFLGNKLIGPLARAAAAGVAPLPDLYRLFPDALLVGQPVPAASAASASSVAAPRAIGFDTPLVEALLSRAMAADAEQADALYLSALEAAEKTPGIDDDLAVLRQLVQAGGARPPSAAVVRRAVSVIGALGERTERRDDAAQLLAWLAYAAIARELTGDLGTRLLKSCQAVLGAVGLSNFAAVRLAAATAELLTRTGKADKARLLLEVIRKRVTEPPLLQELAAARTAIDRTASTMP